MKAIGRSKRRTSRHRRRVTTQCESPFIDIRDTHDGVHVGEMRHIGRGAYATKLGNADLLGQAHLIHEASVESEIRSADDRLCVRLPESMPNGSRRTALVVIGKQCGADKPVYCHSEKGAATIAQLTALPESAFGKLPELIVDGIEAHSFKLTMEGPILSAYLGKAAIPSSSSHLDPAQAKRINTGSKPSRERLVSDLPTVNELDRPEMTTGDQYAIERIPMPQGGFKERERIHKANERDN